MICNDYLTRSRPLVWVLLAGLLPAAARAAEPTAYDWLADWAGLPRARTGMVPGLASSYDRSGENDDYNHYQSPEGLQAGDLPVVALDVAGPGVLTRFWMPHRVARAGFPIRMIIDGQVRIETDSRSLLAGRFDSIGPPLVQMLLGGQVCYEPIPFARSLRIETRNRPHDDPRGEYRHYYQYNYLKLPPARPLASYGGDLAPAARRARRAVVDILRRVGENPAGPCPAAITLTSDPREIPAGATVTLWQIQGAGSIRRLNLRMPKRTTDAVLDGLRLRVRYDGRADPAIDVPVSHFFGAGHGRVAYRSLPLGTDSPDGFYCYWPMPFRRGAAVELRNATHQPITIEAANLEYDPTPPPADAGYLHAIHREARTQPKQAYHVLLNVHGAGHYVGNLLYLRKELGGQALLEGDDVITVNPGRPGQVVLHGTGLEDAYNGGFYYNHAFVQRDDGDVPNPSSGIAPYHGLLRMELAAPGSEGSTRVDQYRWMIGDFVPFRDGIEVKVENFAEQAGVLFGSTAFYYRTQGNASP